MYNCLKSIVLIVIFLILTPFQETLYSEDDYIVIRGGIIPIYDTDKPVKYNVNKSIIISIKDKIIISVSDKYDLSKLKGKIKNINATGKYIIPGLIDGFGAINNQSYANAYLYMGITSLIAVDGGRRGPFFGKGKPSPSIYRLESIGDDTKSTEEHLKDLRILYKKGYKIALLKYALTAEQVKACSVEAKNLGMGVIGELGHTTYREGTILGVNAFVHTTRYSLDIVPRNMADRVADNPFSDDLNSPKWQYYKYLSKVKTDNKSLIEHATTLGQSRVFLMPTLSLLYLDIPNHKNPWLATISQILNAKDINNPANKKTGNHSYTEELQTAYTKLIINAIKIEKTYKNKGAKYLSGSATDVWGTMPGISLHTELELLEKIGLSKKEVIESATINFDRAFGWKRGKLEEGYIADILILNSDPFKSLKNLRDINLIIANAKIINREKLLNKNTSDRKISDSTNFNPILFKNVKKIVLNKAGILKKKYDYLNRVEIKKIHYLSDGLKVTAYISYPKKKGNYPCIIYNRGGNREFGKISPKKTALILARIASWGYVVAGSQYRGNDGGEGKEEFGGKDVNDILNLIPIFAEIPNTNTKKMGMYGWSRGGMMTYLALMRTDKISAAVIGGGLSDLKMMKDDRPEMESVYEELIPNYLINKQKHLFKRSSIKNASKLPKKTPFLILHGTSDWRVKPEQSFLMARAMLKEKIPFRLLMFEGGNHGLTEFNEEVDQMTKEWFDKFLKEDKPLPNLKPHGR